MFNFIATEASEYPVSALFYACLVAPFIIFGSIIITGSILHNWAVNYKMNHFHNTKEHSAQYYRLHYEYEMNHR